MIYYAALGLVAQSCLTLCDPMDGRPPGSSVHGDSPGKNTGGGCHAHLQGILPTQGILISENSHEVLNLHARPSITQLLAVH